MSSKSEYFTHHFSFKDEKLKDVMGSGMGAVKDECGDAYIMGFKVSSAESFQRAMEGEDVKPYIILSFSDISHPTIEFKIEGEYAIEFIKQGIPQAILEKQDHSNPKPSRHQTPKNNTPEKEVNPRELFPGAKQTNAQSSLPKNTVRFDIISEGIVENESCKGYIDLDTMNYVWNICLERENFLNLRKWIDNPYKDENVYIDDNHIDYGIMPWVYAKGENRYYIKFSRYEAGGTEFRVSSKSAQQYLKLWD